VRALVAEDGMPEWMVRLVGADEALRFLARTLSGPEHRVTEEDDGKFYLRSRRFADLDKAEAVKRVADKVVEQVNRAAFLWRAGYQDAKTAEVVRVDPDGSRSVAIIAIGVPAEARSDAHPGTLVPVGPGRPLCPDVALLEQEPSLAAAIDYIRNEPNWTGYYKAFEAICKAAGGEHELWRRGWATREEVESLNDSPQPKRHHKPRRVPRDPMTLPEAKQLLLRLARKLIEWVSAGRP
jgi:hypothetical protein